MTFGGAAPVSLPNSKLQVCYGGSLMMDTDLQNREGIGYCPDIWVHPDESLRRAARFVAINSGT